MKKPLPRKTSVAAAWPGALRPLISSEADHRIRSSLQRVVSLLQLQSTDDRTLTRPEEALSDAAARINAIAHWHAFLSQNQNGGRLTVALDNYLNAFADHFVDVVMAPSRIVLLVNVDPLQVPARVAGMLGQIVNELVINVIRYAFGPQRPGSIQVECGRNASGKLVLQVSAERKESSTRKGRRMSGPFGMKVVAALARQLGGTFAAARPGAAVCHRVTIPMPGRISSSGRERRPGRA